MNIFQDVACEVSNEIILTNMDKKALIKNQN